MQTAAYTPVPHETTDWPWKIPLRRRDGSIRAYALVDEDIYRELADKRCSLSGNGYVQIWFPGEGRRGPGVKGAGHIKALHRYVMRLKPGEKGLDHRNRDKLDNRRTNLRPASHEENGQNQTPQQGRTSRHRGVCWDKSRGKWMAYIKPPGAKLRHLGRYDDEGQAATAAAQARAELMPFNVEL